MRISQAQLHGGMGVPAVLETKRFIDYVHLAEDPFRHGYQMLLRREYKELLDDVERQERLPGWQRFAHARQGIE